LSAYWDTRSRWIKHEEERLAETADPNLCCFCTSGSVIPTERPLQL
jgi:hypothetical protein